MKQDIVEFYVPGIFHQTFTSSIVPHINSIVNVRKNDYKVCAVYYALDFCPDAVRAIVKLRPVEKRANRKKGVRR